MPAFAAWRTNCSGEPHCTPRCASRHTPPKPVMPCTQQRVSTTVAITHPITHNCHPRQARLDSSSSNQQDSRRRNLMWQRKMPHATRASSTHPRHASCSRTAAQSQSLMRSLAPPPASTATPTSISALQFAFGTLATMVSNVAQRVTSLTLPARRQSDARARQSTPREVRRFAYPFLGM